MRKTVKTIEAENWVDNYIIENKKPPTYNEIANGLGISKTASFNRCRNFRQKINTNEKTRIKNDFGTFPFALREIMLGGFVSRSKTKNDTVICLYKREIVQMSQKTGVRYSYTPSNEDLLALDWDKKELDINPYE